MPLSPWEKLLEQPHPGGHFVQLYEPDDAALCRNVGHYLFEGLRRGDGVLVIATRDHQNLFTRDLDGRGIDLAEALETRQLIFCDAKQTLQDFMTAGQPDWLRFEKVMQAAMRQVRPKNRGEEIRAYGEMVGLLWNARQFAAAIRLEQLWNKLLETAGFSLYCAYAIDIFKQDFDIANLDGILCTHTHLVPSQIDGTLDAALKRSMDEILGPQAESLRATIKAHARPSSTVLPDAEGTVLWLRKNLPGQADQIIRRARDHYELLHSPAPL